MQPDPKVKLARDLIPVTDRCTYLSTGSWGPLSQVYTETLRNCLDQELRQGRAAPDQREKLLGARERIRTEIARLVGASVAEIILTQRTTDGLAAVFDGLPWKAGDEVIATQIEHSACSDQLEALAAAGRIVLRTATVPPDLDSGIEWLTDAITPRTRLVAFSAVAFVSGQSLPIKQLASAAAERGVQTMVDGAQSVGAIPLNLDDFGVDYCAMPLQKWLCGPEGMGALFMRRDLTAIPRDDRVTRGWSEFEATAVHLEWLRTSFGWEWIHERTAMLAGYARQKVQEMPQATLLTPQWHAGLVAFTLTTDDAAGVAKALRKRGFVFRYLEDLQAFRISTAFFNTVEEIDAFVALVAASSS